MSDRKLSRGEFVVRAPIKTMADLRDATRCDPVLGPRQKEARVSAINSYSKWAGKSLEELLADPRLTSQNSHSSTRLNAKLPKGVSTTSNLSSTESPWRTAGTWLTPATPPFSRNGRICLPSSMTHS